MAMGLEVTETIAATPSDVFAVSGAIPDWADVIPAITKIEMLTDGPVGVGTRFIETRVIFGREASETMEVLEYENPSHYLLAAESHGSRYRTRFSFVAEGDKTKVVMSFQAEPITFFAKVMSFVMKPMMKKMVALCAKDLAALKNHVEANRAAVPVEA
ncbi:MAG: SRPBCC family protein [Planctomycetota bacterium]